MGTPRKPRVELAQMSRKELYAQLDKVKHTGPRSYSLAKLREILAETAGRTDDFIQLTDNRKAVEIFGRPGVTGPRRQDAEVAA